LAWLSQRQGDRVGLATFTGDLVDVVPPSTRHLQLLLHTLGRARATGAGKLSTAVEKLSHLTARAGIVVLVTDCYESPEALGRAADNFRMRGHDVIVFHLVDSAERDFPFTAATTFEDAETGTRLPLRPDDLRAKYKQLLDAHFSALTKRLAGSGADYVRIETDKPLDFALHAYLDRRLARSRVR
jgi:uncharacterized protein (DUF58 family)